MNDSTTTNGHAHPTNGEHKGPPDALDFARATRREARRLAALVQEAMGCNYEVEMMPRVARRVRRLLNNLERVEALLRRSTPATAGTSLTSHSREAPPL